MPIVTALRGSGRDRVAVELDGTPWRVLPLEAVVRAGLSAGVKLDRRRARTLARERRRLAALAVATGALRHRSLSGHRLDEQLRRKGVAPADRERTLDTLQSAGLVDDGRLATHRAAALAERGYGDAYIRADLVHQGIESDAASAAIAALEPERERAVAELERRGGDVRAARALARRGFSAESLEQLDDLVARDLSAELG